MTNPIASSRILLVAERRTESSEPTASPVRRYRLARLQFDQRPRDGADRSEYLKRG